MMRFLPWKASNLVRRFARARHTGEGTRANIRAAGITIYTIQVDTGGDPTSTLLQKSASNTAGTELTKLRVAK